MAKTPSKPSRGNAIAKWFGLQVASKAVGFALGTPLVTGAVMAVLAYINGLPLAWGFMAVMIVVGATAAALNQGRTFLVSYSTVGKLHFPGLFVSNVQHDDGRLGFAIAIVARNQSDIPLVYSVTRATGQIDGLAAQVIGLDDPTVIQARTERGRNLCFVPLKPSPMQGIRGELEIEYDYGRPGKLNSSGHHKWRINVQTDPNGQAAMFDSGYI